MSEPPTPGSRREASFDARREARWQAARRAWPGVHVAARPFWSRVAERCGEDLEHVLDALAIEDLYLAHGCVHGDRRALEHLERGPMARLRGPIERIVGPDGVDEVMQEVRRDLLTADGGCAGLAGYAGRGSLLNFLRVVAIRCARKHAHERTRRPLVRIDDALAALAGEPELEYLRERYRDEVAAALTHALGALPRRERNLLRHHYVDALGIRQIGAIYHVHPSTAARQLARARERTFVLLRAQLEQRLGVSASQLDSIVGLVRSGLEVSLRQALGGARDREKTSRLK